MIKTRGESLTACGFVALFSFLVAACSPESKNPADFFKVQLADLSDLPRDTAVIEQEWLVQSGADLDSQSLADDLQAQGLSIVSVQPLLGEVKGAPTSAMTLAPVPSQATCRPLFNRLYRVKVGAEVSQEQALLFLSQHPDLKHVEPHLVMASSQDWETEAGRLSKSQLYSAIVRENNAKNWVTVSILAQEYLRRFFDNKSYGSQQGTVFKALFESLLQRKQFTILAGIISNAIPSPLIEVMSTSPFLFKLHFKSEIDLAYQYWLQLLTDARADTTRIRLEEAILADKDMKYLTTAQKIRLRRQAEKTALEEEQKKILAQQRLEKFIQSQKWLDAAKLLVTTFKDQLRALQILRDQWLPWQLTQPSAEWATGIQYYLSLLKKTEGTESFEKSVMQLMDQVSTEQRINLQKPLEEIYVLHSQSGKKTEEELPQLRPLAQQLEKYFPNSVWLATILQQRQAYQVLLQTRAQEKLATIKYLKDPHNPYIWAFHSEFEVIRQAARSFKYQMLKTKPATRYDLHLREVMLALEFDKLQDVLVAVIDTGIDGKHPDLKDVIDTAKPGINLVGNLPTAQWQDDNGHGSHVSGTIAAAFDQQGISGINPRAKLLPVKVLNSNGSGSMQSVLNGVVYAHEMGAKVINLSLGSRYFSEIAQSVYDCIAQQGVLIVAAAGNNGAFEGHFPSDYNSVLSVAASDYQGRRASFSNYGTGVDLTAPGVQILSTYPVSLSASAKNPFFTHSNMSPYAVLNGTSMATPMVAGAASLLMSRYPELSADEVQAILMSTAEPLAAVADQSSIDQERFPWDYRLLMGDGLIRLDSAMQAPKARPWIKVQNQSETFNLDIDKGKMQDLHFTLPLALKNFWKTANDTKIRISEVPVLDTQSDRLNLDLEQSEWQIPKFITGDQVKLDARFTLTTQNQTDESQTRLFELQSSSAEGSNKDYFALHIESFMRVFSVPGRSTPSVSKPDTQYWLDFLPEWGLFTERVDGNLWSASILKTTDYQSNSDLLYMNVTDQQGRAVTGMEYRSHMIGLRPQHVLAPADYRLNGQREMLLYSIHGNSSEQTKIKSDYQLPKGFHVFSGQLKSVAYHPFNEEAPISMAARDGFLAVVVANRRQSDFKDLPYSDYVEGQLIVFDIRQTPFKELSRKPVQWFKKSAAKVLLCPVPSEAQPLIIWTAGLYTGAERFPQEANTLEFEVYESSGKKLQETVMNGSKGFDLKNSSCGSVVEGEPQFMLQVKDHSKSYFQRELMAFAWNPATENLQQTWQVTHEGYHNPMALSILDWPTVGTVIVFNSSHDKVLAVQASSGKALTGFPLSAPQTVLQSGFHLQAVLADLNQDGQKELVIVEPADRIHSFDLQGRPLKSWKKAGNYYGKGLVLPQANGGDRLWLTGHRGLHRL